MSLSCLVDTIARCIDHIDFNLVKNLHESHQYNYFIVPIRINDKIGASKYILLYTTKSVALYY